MSNPEAYTTTHLWDDKPVVLDEHGAPLVCYGCAHSISNETGREQATYPGKPSSEMMCIMCIRNPHRSDERETRGFNMHMPPDISETNPADLYKTMATLKLHNHYTKEAQDKLYKTLTRILIDEVQHRMSREEIGARLKRVFGIGYGDETNVQALPKE